MGRQRNAAGILPSSPVRSRGPDRPGKAVAPAEAGRSIRPVLQPRPHPAPCRAGLWAFPPAIRSAPCPLLLSLTHELLFIPQDQLKCPLRSPLDALSAHLTLQTVGVPQFAAAAAQSLQSRPTLRDPTDGSPPGSPVPGILQARALEWAAISFSSA